ncbi:MAG: hypothetical protein SXG53_17010 [Pseudomonadota bacterium]|nr:hypothetical protein [Pseudomonadota bacterium]
MLYGLGGLLLISVVGYLTVAPFLERIRGQMPLPSLSRSVLIEAAWSALTSHPKASGDWVGIFERIVLFWALYESSWEAVGIWIVFKVAAKWEARSHLAHMPESIKDVPELEWAAARRVWAAREYVTFVVGTACNLLLAAAGVWIARCDPTAVQAIGRAVGQ